MNPHVGRNLDIAYSYKLLASNFLRRVYVLILVLGHKTLNIVKILFIVGHLLYLSQTIYIWGSGINSSSFFVILRIASQPKPGALK